MNQGKQYGELSLLDQKRRDLLASEGLVCIDCGQPSDGLCDDCRKEWEQSCETDIVETRSYGDELAYGDNHGEDHIRVYEKATGKLLSEFDTVSIHDVPTPKNLIELLGWAREN